MKRNVFILVLALQAAWLLATVVQQERALSSGKTVLLETERMDPRDLLRGDYLILNYKISTIPTNLFSPPVTQGLPNGSKVFIALAPGTNDFYKITRASTQKFLPAEGEVLLYGKSAWPTWNTTNSIRVEYGLERYFVAEGTGNPTGKLTVRAIVPASGRGKIQEVFVDGRPYAEAMK